jgi:hypothetical protein
MAEGAGLIPACGLHPYGALRVVAAGAAIERSSHPALGWRVSAVRKLAEGAGFEPAVACATFDFESSALNRTQPPFLKVR